MNSDKTTGKAIGEIIDQARRKSGEPTLEGHDIMALERFDENTRHMIVFNVLSDKSPVGFKGDKVRMFLTDIGYQKALESQNRGEMKVQKHAKISHGNLIYDRKKQEMR